MESISTDKTKYLDIAPPDWDRTTIGEIFKFSSGKAKPPKTSKIRTKKFAFPIYGGNGIMGYADEFIFDEPKLILGRVGEYCGCAHLTEKFSWISDNALYAKEINGDIDYNYFKFFFDYFDLNRFSNKNGQPLITQGNISSLEMAKPHFEIQNKISFVLSTLQKAIEKQQQIIDTTQALKKSLLHELFTKGTKGEKLKETEIGLMPKSWEVVKLGKYAYIENGFAFQSSDYIKQGVPLVRISNVSHGQLIDKDTKYLPESLLKSHSNFSLKEGDLIISLTRPVTSGGLKYCFIENKHIPALLNQRVGRFQIKNDKKISKNYLYHLVFSQFFVGELEKLFGNSSQQPNVSPSQLESFIVPIPDLVEQNLISETLFSLNNKIYMHQSKMNILGSVFKSLLNELMTGNLSVDSVNFSDVQY